MGTRKGFTLIELLIAMVLFLIVGSAVFSLLTNTQRVSRAQAEHADMQSNMRAGALIVPADLRMIGYDFFDAPGTTPTPGVVNSDILGMAADSIAFRAIRSSGAICNLMANAVVVDTNGFYSGYRVPQQGRDGLMIYAELNPKDGADDLWLRRQITGNPGVGLCTVLGFAGRPGLTIPIADVAPGDSILLGAPVHTFEVMAYKLIQSDGRWWLGARSISAGEAGYQPMLGPLASNGFRLEYRDANGALTAVPAQVRTVEVTLLAESDSRVTGTGYGSQNIITDSVVTRVALRNSMR
ncbi:MAG TPA: prepilin-type N-terminal cleavage/methylation domain-containing protein [Gemmatimonadales bacterium]|nr:prepilin-type N-terminal cleavage/methylation domain-containing protein [Gemmatimonadales bacterium]